MRTVRPMIHATRVVTRFLWFPLTIGRETRWLERVSIRQRYFDTTQGPYIPLTQPRQWWQNVEFVD